MNLVNNPFFIFLKNDKYKKLFQITNNDVYY